MIQYNFRVVVVVHNLQQQQKQRRRAVGCTGDSAPSVDLTSSCLSSCAAAARTSSPPDELSMSVLGGGTTAHASSLSRGHYHHRQYHHPYRPFPHRIVPGAAASALAAGPPVLLPTASPWPLQLGATRAAAAAGWGAVLRPAAHLPDVSRGGERLEPRLSASGSPDKASTAAAASVALRLAADTPGHSTSGYQLAQVGQSEFQLSASRRLYILCWRELSRLRLLPAVSPAAGHLATPTVAGLPSLCENFRPTTSKSSRI